MSLATDKGNTDSHFTARWGARLQDWIRRHIIDDEPFDQEAWNTAMVNTAQVLNTEPFPKELR